MIIKVSWMKSKLWMIVLVLILIQPLNALPNFGFNDPKKEEDLPIPVRDSAFTANLVVSTDYPELVYISEDNKVIVIDTFDLKFLYPVEIEGNIKKALVEDLENDGIPELIILSDLKIAVYSDEGKQEWSKDLDSPGVDMDLLKDISEDVYHIVVAEKDLVQAFSHAGDILWPEDYKIKEKNENYKIITTNVDQKSHEEIILVHKDSISALSHNGVEKWKSSFEEPISAVCEFSPPNSILVSLKNGNFYFVDESGRNNIIENARMNTAILVPWKSSMNAYLSGFFVVSSYGHLRAYNSNGETIGDLTEFKKTVNVISCDLDDHNAKRCGIDSYIANMEEHVIISEEGEVSVLIFCPKNQEEQQCENCWRLLPLGIDEKGEKIKKIETGMKDISLSLVFRVNNGSFLLLMTHTGTICRYEIFSNANLFLSNFDRTDFLLKTNENFTEAFELLKDFDEELAQYYGLYQGCITKQDECQKYFESEKKQAKQKLSNGLDKIETDAFGAVKDLFEAYKGFKKANFREDDVVDEEQDLTIKDVKEMILHSVFPLLKEADEEYAEENYEKALTFFSRIYPAYEEFSVYPVYEEFTWYIEDIANETEDFEEYGTLILKYPNHGAILPIINFCKENTEEDADNLFDEGKFKDAKDKYETIRMTLIDKGESEDSNAVKEITDKIAQCDLGIQKLRIELLVISSLLGFPFMFVVLYVHKIRKFPKDNFETYLIRIKTRRAWDRGIITFIIFFVGFIFFIELQRHVNLEVSLIGFFSVFFLILLIYIFLDFFFYYRSPSKDPISYVLQRIKGGESETVEFKREWSNITKITKEMVAFANTKGGSILFGVGDNREIIGVPEGELKQLEQKILNCASNNVQPALSPQIEKRRMSDGKLIIEVIIEEDLRKINMDRDNKIWIRKHSHCYTADPEELAELFSKKSG